MLKKIIFSAAALSLAISASAQTLTELPLGYNNITELGFIKSAFDNSNTFAYGIHTINGMQFNQRLFAGIGIGYERSQYGGNLLPVFADARVYFGKKEIKPFINQTLGYSFHIFSQEFIETFNTKGLYTANTSVGLAIPVKFAQHLNISLGYRMMHRTKIKFSFDERSFTHHYLTLKAGLTF